MAVRRETPILWPTGIGNRVVLSCEHSCALCAFIVIWSREWRCDLGKLLYSNAQILAWMVEGQGKRGGIFKHVKGQYATRSVNHYLHQMNPLTNALPPQPHCHTHNHQIHFKS